MQAQGGKFAVRVDAQHDKKTRDTLSAQLPEMLKKYLREPVTQGQGLSKLNSEAGPLTYCLACLCCPYALGKMVLVKEGEIGLSWHGKLPQILAPGRHFLLSCTHTLLRVVAINDPIIIHGPINIVRVRVGELGFGIESESGNPVLLTPGKHIINSPTFKFVKMLDMTAPVNQLGALKLVRVETGQVGYAYVKGKLSVFQPGLHVIVPPDRFAGTISTQQQTLDLGSTIHESSDYVPLAIRADVFYRIVDPGLALTKVKNVEKQIKETSISTLAGIIRSSTLAEIAGSSKASHSEETAAPETKAPVAAPGGGGGGVAKAPPFYRRVHDEFIEELNQNYTKSLGIEIVNIRIESLKINDRALASSISQQAIEVSRMEAKYRMLQKQADIVKVEADNRATEKKISMDADVLVIKRKAEAERMAAISKAEGEAKAIIIKAEAAKKARVLMGEGDASYSSELGKSKLGAQLAQMKVQAEMMKGLKQVAYVPHLPDILKSTQMVANIGGMGT